MRSTVTVTPAQLPEVLLHVAVVRPVFLWGAPGIGESSLVRKFAAELGLECVTLLGTQLAPEDLIGVPELVGGRSRFAPPESIARQDPYGLFLDELNASSPEVQKAFYSLILDRRIGSYDLPKGSIVIGAGNRAVDDALARPMASALVNRMVHVHLTASAKDWLGWARENDIHPWVLEYLTQRPDHLWSAAPKVEEMFSTPRGWHTLSDALHDSGLRGLSVESVYDRITTDLRRYRKLLTLRGKQGDLLGEPLRGPSDITDLDEFYRRALLTGLSCHTVSRGLLPAGLVEEIRALEHPPLSWDAQLARWFEEFVPAAEKRRTYARASRRQASTPDIPRPGRVRPETLESRPTFGVVLDTSGSMDPQLLGKALGAIASYAAARDVPAARVVFCDAMAYDAGYVPVEDIAGRVKVRGRGGTVLQPGIDLLERADDFPSSGPILVVTDGWCDVLRIRREHAFLIPAGSHLPFRARGPVFRMS